MPDANRPSLPLKSHPTVHAIASAWRRLSGGKSVRDADRRTLIACSGGADSGALVLALAHRPESIVVAHIVHDMRPAAESSRCLESARALAGSLGVRFVSASIAAKQGGVNYEAAARTLRYAALDRLAIELGCRFIATAHHAEDQLETVLLRLLRGAGPRGFAGIRARRKLPSGVTIIRPMLPLSRNQARALCTESDWQWSQDATNSDLSHRRAAIRATVLPHLLAIDPQAPHKAADSARLALRTADHLDRAARTLAQAAATTEPNTFSRDQLRAADPIVLLTWLRSLDSQSPLRTLESIARAIRSTSGESRQWAMGQGTLRTTRTHVIAVREPPPRWERGLELGVSN